jgi:hypothetical protein
MLSKRRVERGRPGVVTPTAGMIERPCSARGQLRETAKRCSRRWRPRHASVGNGTRHQDHPAVRPGHRKLASD